MKIFHINASTRGVESQSLAVAERLIEKLHSTPDTTLDRLDLFDGSLPPFDANAVAAKMALFTGTNTTVEQKATWAKVEAVFKRFASADVYVMNTPLWNNGIPYALKQFIDLVTQPGWAFGFDPVSGYAGLLKGKKAYVVHASGVYHEGIRSNFGSDFSTPYLADWFQFIGVTDLEQIHVAPTVVNANYAVTKAKAIARAEALAGQMERTA